MMAEESDETRGLSIRELLLELRQDVKDQNGRISKRPTRTEVLATLGTGGALVFGLVKLLS